MNNNKAVYLSVLIIASLFSFLAFPNAILLEHTSIVLLFVILAKFIIDLNSKLSVINLIALIAVLQWLLGAVLGYQYSNLISLSYQMIIPKENYFLYVFPATLAMILGLNSLSSGIKVRKLLISLDFSKTYNKGVFLILIGFAADFLPSLGFLGYLISCLKYVGAFYVFFSYHPMRYIWLTAVLGLLFIRSISQGMFHEFLLWGTFYFSGYFIINRKSLLFRSLLLISGLLLMMAIQLSKSEIREKSWTGAMAGKEMYAYGLNTIFDKLTGKTSLFFDESLGGTITRLNQGWIISNVMANIPKNSPFANGESVKNSILGKR